MQNVIAFIGDPDVLAAALSALSLPKHSPELVTVSKESELIERLNRGSLVLTDLPEPSGMDMLRSIVSHNAPKFSTPVVILTSARNEQLAVQALRDVATSYLPSRLIESELAHTVRNVFAVANAHQNRMRIMECVTHWHNEFVLENDNSLIGPLVRYLQESTQRMGLLSEPGEETRLGIALEEALLNSIYHGSLEVSSELREEDDSKFYALINQRRNESPYSARRVRVRAEFSREKVTFTIEDEGPGFDISKVPDPTKPDNVEKVCGRGMLLMRTFMDEVEYNDIGNQVTMTKRRQDSDPS